MLASMMFGGGVDQGPMSRSAMGGDRHRTIIVDKCPLFREGFRGALHAAGFEVVASAFDLKSVRLDDHVPVRGLMIIMGASDDLTADVHALHNAHARFPGGILVALRENCLPEHAAQLLRAGASAILPVPNDVDDFADILKLVAAGQRVVPVGLLSSCLCNEEDDAPEPLDDVAAFGVDAHLTKPPNRLSVREIEILRCLLGGESNRVIARRLIIGEATVKVHVKSILRKIKVKNRTQAAIWAISNMSPFTNQPVTSTA